MKNKIINIVLIAGMLNCALSYGFEISGFEIVPERKIEYYHKPVDTLQIKGTANNLNIYQANDGDFLHSLRYISWNNEIKMSVIEKTKTVTLDINQIDSLPIKILVPHYVSIKKIINLTKGDVTICAPGDINAKIQEGKVTLNVSQSSDADITVSKGTVDLMGLKDAHADLDLYTTALFDSNKSREPAIKPSSFLWWKFSHYKGRIGTVSPSTITQYSLIKVWVEDGHVSLEDNPLKFLN